MSNICLSVTIFILSISFIGYHLGGAKNLAHAASENLVWKPYLQQLTDTSVTILWMTNTGSNVMVRYAPDISYSEVVAGTSSPISELNTQLHRVELTGLQPDTTYYYKIYTEGQDLLPDEILSFKTAPYPGSITPFTFLAVGDYGKGDESQFRLRDQMLLDSFSFFLTTGDNAYPDGTFGDFDQNVFQIYGDIFSRSPIFPTLGNHDYHTDDGAPYLDLFDLPAEAWQPNDAERYYSFDYGNAHFVALDSNTPLYVSDGAASDDMFDWLRNDLSQTTQPWKIVALHSSAYSTGKHGSSSRVQSRLVPIFEEYGVDLVLSGHDHIYQRSKPLLAGQETTVEAGGIVYIVSGAGNRASYKCSDASWSAVKYCDESYGLYARITINGASLTVEAIDEAGVVKDYYVIENDTLASAPVKSVSVSGPIIGAIQTSHIFSATVSPISTTLPITYTWQATGQPPQIHTGGLTDTVVFTWDTVGTQVITVTATNIEGAATDSRIMITTSSNIYLPVLLRKG